MVREFHRKVSVPTAAASVKPSVALGRGLRCRPAERGAVLAGPRRYRATPSTRCIQMRPRPHSHSGLLAHEVIRRRAPSFSGDTLPVESTLNVACQGGKPGRVSVMIERDRSNRAQYQGRSTACQGCLGQSSSATRKAATQRTWLASSLPVDRFTHEWRRLVSKAMEPPMTINATKVATSNRISAHFPHASTHTWSCPRLTGCNDCSSRQPVPCGLDSEISKLRRWSPGTGGADTCLKPERAAFPCREGVRVASPPSE
jgi:hypothetical protein